MIPTIAALTGADEFFKVSHDVSEQKRGFLLAGDL